MGLYELSVSIPISDYLKAKALCRAEAELNHQVVVRDNTSTEQKVLRTEELVVSKWAYRNTEKDAIERAVGLAQFFISEGIRVDQMQVKADIDLLPSDYVLKPEEAFEFRIQVPVANPDEYTRFVQLCRNHGARTHDVVKSESMDFVPVGTLQIHQGSKQDAMEKNSAWIQAVKLQKFRISFKVRQDIILFHHVL